MLFGITENKEIESLNKKLHSNLKKFISGKYERKIIYPQGSRSATIYFSKNFVFLRRLSLLVFIFCSQFCFCHQF